MLAKDFYINIFFNLNLAELYEISPYATFGGAAAHSLQFRTLARREDDAAPPHRRRRRACDHYRYGKIIFGYVLTTYLNITLKILEILYNNLDVIRFIIINLATSKLFSTL